MFSRVLKLVRRFNSLRYACSSSFANNGICGKDHFLRSEYLSPVFVQWSAAETALHANVVFFVFVS